MLPTTHSPKQPTGPKWSEIEYRLLDFWVQNDRDEMKRRNFSLQQVAEEMNKETKWLHSQQDLGEGSSSAEWQCQIMRFPTRNYNASKLSTKMRMIETNPGSYVPLPPRNPDRFNMTISGNMAKNIKGNDKTYEQATAISAPGKANGVTDSRSILDTQSIAGMANTGPTYQAFRQSQPLAGVAYNRQTEFGQELPAFEVDRRRPQSLEQPATFEVQHQFSSHPSNGTTASPQDANCPSYESHITSANHQKFHEDLQSELFHQYQSQVTSFEHHGGSTQVDVGQEQPSILGLSSNPWQQHSKITSLSQVLREQDASRPQNQSQSVADFQRSQQLLPRSPTQQTTTSGQHYSPDFINSNRQTSALFPTQNRLQQWQHPQFPPVDPSIDRTSVNAVVDQNLYEVAFRQLQQQIALNNTQQPKSYDNSNNHSQVLPETMKKGEGSEDWRRKLAALSSEREFSAKAQSDNRRNSTVTSSNYDTFFSSIPRTSSMTGAAGVQTQNLRNSSSGTGIGSISLNDREVQRRIASQQQKMHASKLQDPVARKPEPGNPFSSPKRMKVAEGVHVATSNAQVTRPQPRRVPFIAPAQSSGQVPRVPSVAQVTSSTQPKNPSSVATVPSSVQPSNSSSLVPAQPSSQPRHPPSLASTQSSVETQRKDDAHSTSGHGTLPTPQDLEKPSKQNATRKRSNPSPEPIPPHPAPGYPPLRRSIFATPRPRVPRKSTPATTSIVETLPQSKSVSDATRSGAVYSTKYPAINVLKSGFVPAINGRESAATPSMAQANTNSTSVTKSGSSIDTSNEAVGRALDTLQEQLRVSRNTWNN
ncbi:hypothetical protein GLAREA_06561 [Glarea lozoyensis ATCC 20868]|uniref:Uncharacterized protein n=1 Tax=Glarea lozoyensis (strain ATCC 20868 / MF5171) TaxID=1116229 RepID=S3E557_GLAL2|nr:uncharacterized protein GLAREA_06561 [Glarea lozoyensis ATCC 20868]EPE33548.1 hypothetical protein GLAREA_06561 [Glarea lozoyensis ATCC 20868]